MYLQWEFIVNDADLVIMAIILHQWPNGLEIKIPAERTLWKIIFFLSEKSFSGTPSFYLEAVTIIFPFRLSTPAFKIYLNSPGSLNSKLEVPPNGI